MSDHKIGLRKKTEAYLDEMGIKIPLLGDARISDMADLSKNKRLKEFVEERLVPEIFEKITKKEAKQVASAYMKDYAPHVMQATYESVCKIMLSNIIVDTIEEDTWLDFEKPLLAKVKSVLPYNHTSSMVQIWLGEEIEPSVDYVTTKVSIYLFHTVREIRDDASKEQLLGNIGALEDIRSAVAFAMYDVIANETEIKRIRKEIKE